MSNSLLVITEMPSLKETKVYEDVRGYFSPVWSKEEWAINESFSRERVFRGLHVQYPPQRKELRVLSGRIIDIWVSPNGNAGAVELTEGDGVLEIPKGYLHGFIALEPTLVQYLVEGKYSPKTERSYSLKSPKIVWCGVEPDLRERIFNILKDYDRLIMSKKDRKALNFNPGKA